MIRDMVFSESDEESKRYLDFTLYLFKQVQYRVPTHSNIMKKCH